jgi:hypothetical protein
LQRCYEPQQRPEFNRPLASSARTPLRQTAQPVFRRLYAHDQERRFLKILEAVARFEIGADGSLILQTDDARSVTTRHKG